MDNYTITYSGLEDKPNHRQEAVEYDHLETDWTYEEKIEAQKEDELLEANK